MFRSCRALFLSMCLGVASLAPSPAALANQDARPVDTHVHVTRITRYIDLGLTVAQGYSRRTNKATVLKSCATDLCSEITGYPRTSGEGLIRTGRTVEIEGSLTSYPTIDVLVSTRISPAEDG